MSSFPFRHVISGSLTFALLGRYVTRSTARRLRNAQAGTKFNIDWSFLASIGAQECGNGSCAGTNSAGCAGPMQIA
jgi:hypothetical protein